MAATRLRRFILPLICLIFSFVPAKVGSAAFHEACKKVDPKYQDYCVQALSSAPKIRKASDTAGVAAVALKLAAKNTTSSSQYLEKMCRENDEDELQECLVVCKEDYLDAVEHLSDAQVVMKKGRYKKVLRYVEAALDFIKYCKNACRSVPKQENPLTQRNKDVRILCTITTSLVKQLIS